LTRSDNHRQAALQPWFERFGSISHARQRAAWFSRQAGESLATLAPGAARDSLCGLARFVVARQQ